MPHLGPCLAHPFGRHLIALAILCLLLAVLSPVSPASAGERLLLFYANDVRGETAPCG